MKAVILAGGMGTRIGEETKYRPKPMVEIGDKPILWHIMKRYSMFDIEDFIVCCGYKGHMIKKYFMDYYMKYSNVTFDMTAKKTTYLDNQVEPWDVTLVNTGLDTLTAGRVKVIKKYVKDDEFLLTYGDGVADIDIDKLIECHHNSGKVLTISVTKPEGRFGAVSLNEETGEIYGFKEKARTDQSYVNIGFMVCSPQIFDYLGEGNEMLETGPFDRLLADRQLNAYLHDGFWSPMDNLKDKEYLEELYYSDKAKWLKT